MKLAYEEMLPHEINAVLRECPLAYLVWGSHEWHGVHNAVGLDTIKAYRMTLDLCRETGGVVLPPVYCGYQTMKPWARCRHTLEFSKDLVTRYVFEHLENLYDEGFKAMVVVMGHYGGKHVEAVKAGVAQFSERHRYPKVLAITDYEPASWIQVKGGDHAGRNETSLMLHYRPDLVDLSRLPEGELDGKREGCSVDARDASAEHGALLARTFVEQAAPKVRELLEAALRDWPAIVSTGD
ncbi:MAG: creatininase family protein [Lentisphaeria bacterium]|nr:creatininase family protein [Lentisphaeria bacterium]